MQGEESKDSRLSHSYRVPRTRTRAECSRPATKPSPDRENEYPPGEQEEGSPDGYWPDQPRLRLR